MAKYQSKILILGSGPGGYTAGIYAARAGMDPILVCGEQVGGQLTITSDIENFPGFEEPVNGFELMQKMRNQAEKLGVKVVEDTITEAELDRHPFVLSSQKWHSYIAETIIVSTGASVKWLGIEGEHKFKGFGVSACAHCDGFFYKDKNVVVIGGGNTAVSEALHLTKFAKSVTLIHRRDSLKADKTLQERLFANHKINILWNCVAEEIFGDDNPKILKGIKLRNIINDNTQDMKTDGVFVAVGRHPNTDIFKNQLELDKDGYIVTRPDCCRTSVDGVFACGDVRALPFRQAIIAAGSGCIAALEAYQFVENK